MLKQVPPRDITPTFIYHLIQQEKRQAGEVVGAVTNGTGFTLGGVSLCAGRMSARLHLFSAGTVWIARVTHLVSYSPLSAQKTSPPSTCPYLHPIPSAAQEERSAPSTRKAVYSIMC